MAYESSKSSAKNAPVKAGTSAKSAAKLAATGGDTKSGLPTMAGSEVTFQECDAIEEEIAALRVAYEHYFLGTERHPPTRQYEDLKKRVMRLKGSFVRNTSAKFRVQSIHGKFVTYERLWQRTMQEIENGTYKRDVAKARRRIDKKTGDKSRKQSTTELPEEDLEALDAPVAPVPAVAPAIPAIAPLAPGVAPLVPAMKPVSPPPPPASGIPGVAPLVPAMKPVSPPPPPASGIPGVAPLVPAMKPVSPPLAPAVPAMKPVSPPLAPTIKPLVPSGVTPSGVPAVAPVAARPAAVAPPPRPAAQAARPPAVASAGDLSDAKLKSVYDAYVAAKRHNKEDTSKMSYDTVAASLRKQVPELMKQHKASSVEFKVVIKDGKAVLKAVPK